MDNIINLKELRQNVAKYANLVKKGESFLVLKRSKPLFRITPAEEENWETVIDFTKFRKNGIPAQELLDRLKALS